MKRIILFISLLLSCGVAVAQPRELTVQEFLKLSRTDTASYIVRGVVEKVRSSTSGSFYLKDHTGTMLVYGIADPANPALRFSALDAEARRVVLSALLVGTYHPDGDAALTLPE